jgi:hypothetical protein
VRTRTASGASCALVLACLAVAPPVGAAAEERPRRVEVPVATAAADARKVKESFVRIHDPLPASAGAHPEACDWISYLRFRSASGPRRSRDAEGVLAIIPGFLGGASSFDQVARNTVRAAAKRGTAIEFWALDRRSNCLEDHTGVEAAARAGDAALAYDYYWRSREVDGRTFGGFVSPSDAAWLREVGLERTMLDWLTVLREGIPGRRQRARKVICGGHSMGGPLTAAFSSWDFDGDPATTNDAGYSQCAGLVGLDTSLRLTLPGNVLASPSGVLLLAAIASGSPYVNTPPLTPETVQLPAVFGVGAFHDPDATDLIGSLPPSLGIDLAQRFLFSRDAAHFATGIPSIRDFTLTNELVLAGVFDDNSAPLFFLRASVGFPTGGPLVEKNFPAPDPTAALPAEPSTPLYAWQDYDEVEAGGAAVPLNGQGQPFTSRESEVSSVHELARTMFEAPANFIEQYFPTRLLTDLRDAGAGEIPNLAHDGPAKLPAIVVNAGDSADNTGEDAGAPYADEPPNDRRLSRTVVVPGYNHLDVLTASRRQNDGRAEPTAEALARFAVKVLDRGR